MSRNTADIAWLSLIAWVGMLECRFVRSVGVFWGFGFSCLLRGVVCLGPGRKNDSEWDGKKGIF